LVTRRSECPIAYALDLVGDRWTLLVIRDIAIQGKRHYSEFESGPEGISTNILADRLDRLVSAGIVEKSRDARDGKRRVYRLTPKGVDLLPILVEMIVWSGKHDPESPVTAQFLRRAADERESILAEYRERATRAVD
jgi:DNA-binding HxlR family transcriptional regulator